jgi:putative RecB family exonuclease
MGGATAFQGPGTAGAEETDGTAGTAGTAETAAALPAPRTLSPSAMGAFTSCGLAFRFSYVERLPEPPSAPASKGTLVHRALERLMVHAPSDRTIATALCELDAAVTELAEHAEFAGLDLTADERVAFRADAEALVRRYFELEDPAEVNWVGLELKLEATLETGVTLRGIIDRLELDEHGDLVVTDYKTGSSPSERWEAKSLAGVHLYSVLCERALGRRPARVQLLYLSVPEAIVARPTDGSSRGVVARSTAVMDAVRRACSTGDFRPRRSALCDFCSFQEFCPEFGGDPTSAAVVLRERAAAAAGRPPLPLGV